MRQTSKMARVLENHITMSVQRASAASPMQLVVNLLLVIILNICVSLLALYELLCIITNIDKHNGEMKMTLQKEIAQTLDSIAFGGTATGKQIWFIAGLMAKLGCSAGEVATDFANEYRMMSKAKASRVIDEYKNQLGWA